MKKILPALVAGFAAGVFSIIPFAKSLSCCLIIPAASILAVYLQIKVNRESLPISLSKGVVLGLLTGIFAALFSSFFDLFITYITKTNELINAFPQMQQSLSAFPLSDELKKQVVDMMAGMVEEIKSTGFSFLYSISIIFNNLIFDSIFGLLGGLIGVQIFNSRMKRFE